MSIKNKVCGKTLLERYEQSRADLKVVHAKNYDNLREKYEEQALECVLKEYKKCYWRGSLFAKDALKYNRHIFDHGILCTTVQLSDKGIFFLSANGLIRPLIGYNNVHLHLNNLISLLEVITRLNKSTRK